MLTGISAITLATHDIARAVVFYQARGFALKYGGPTAGSTSLHAGSSYLNPVMMPPERIWSWWGRAIFYVDDVDATVRSSCIRWLETRIPATRRIMGREVFPYTRSGGDTNQLCVSYTMIAQIAAPAIPHSSRP
jgi:hypothetical protein